MGLQFGPWSADDSRMRWILLCLLIAATAASASQPLPRGTLDFQLAFSRSQVDSALAARGVQVISSGPTHVSCDGASPSVEFEQYEFAPTAGGEAHLWRVTVAYRVPYVRADFDSLERALVGDLGPPSEKNEPAASDLDGVHKVSWVDSRTAVQLAARWPERPDPRADRMLLVWTDRRLQKLVDAERRQKPKSK